MSSLGLRFDAGELMASLRLAPLDIRVKATGTLTNLPSRSPF